MLNKVVRYVAHLPGVDQARVSYRAKQQHTAFAEKVRLAGKTGVAEFSLERELAKLRPQRRPLSQRPRVLGVGHDNWEVFGLWPSFQRISSFELLSLPIHLGEPWTERDRETVTSK